MARAFGSVSLLLIVLVIGFMLTSQQSANSRKQQTQAVDQAQAAASGISFQQAETQLEQQHSLNGTYAGTSLAGFGVTLVRADARTYCIQNATAHLAGPGGVAATGPC
jgi:predicted lipid-binding transport protein (Tim44 family)